MLLASLVLSLCCKSNRVQKGKVWRSARYHHMLSNQCEINSDLVSSVYYVFLQMKLKKQSNDDTSHCHHHVTWKTRHARWQQQHKQLLQRAKSSLYCRRFKVCLQCYWQNLIALCHRQEHQRRILHSRHLVFLSPQQRATSSWWENFFLWRHHGQWMER